MDCLTWTLQLHLKLELITIMMLLKIRLDYSLYLIAAAYLCYMLPLLHVISATCCLCYMLPLLHVTVLHVYYLCCMLPLLHVTSAICYRCYMLPLLYVTSTTYYLCYILYLCCNNTPIALEERI